jgi:magnesium chelatase family protein
MLFIVYLLIRIVAHKIRNYSRCTSEQIRRYRDRLSGPLLDRIDMHVPVRALKQGELLTKQHNESSVIIRERVKKTRQTQLARQGKINHQLQASEIETYCAISHQDSQFLEQAIEKLGLSTRALHRVLKLSRTLADMAEKDQITLTEISEALSYRTLDRQVS